ncbi:MAG: YceI family protein [Chitinophagaceae bacterium]|nr:YceI family protein [Chitinophagaceae bacterium]
MKLVFMSIALFAIVSITGCNRTKNTSTGEALIASTESGDHYMIEMGEKNIVKWIGSKPVGKHNGTFAISEGHISVSNGSVVSGNFTIDIKTLTVSDIPIDAEENAKLKGHLLSPDFFQADSFPTARFEIVAVEPFDASKIQDKEEFKTDFTPESATTFIVSNPTHLVTGNFTLKGITKSITIPTSIVLENDVLVAEAKFNIDRKDWNLVYGDETQAMDKLKDKFIYNTVNVEFHLQASKQMTHQ